MKTDKWFEDKAIELARKLLVGGLTGCGQDIDIISLTLKEVAKEQRYACVEAINQEFVRNKFDRMYQNEITSIIQNANIGEDK